MGQSVYTLAQMDEASRLALTPGHLAAQLPEVESPIITGVASSGTEYVIQGTDQLTLITARDFTYDVGNDRFFFSRTGATGVQFNLSASISFAQNAAAAEVTVRVTKNGTALGDVYIKRTIANANTVGVGSINGHFSLDGDSTEGAGDGDYVEITVESTKSGDFATWAFATDIKEEAE